jgi:DNA-binding CsgD family transcriptional regulator
LTNHLDQGTITYITASVSLVEGPGWPEQPRDIVAEENAVSIVQIDVLGNCYKCGQEFRRADGSRTCPNCRRSTEGAKPLNPQLTFRERQVVALVSRGKLNKEVAFELHLSEGTIKEYLNRIFRKLGVSNRTELAVWSLMRQHQHQPGELVA